MMRKVILSFILILTILFSNYSFVFSKNFDYSNQWALENDGTFFMQSRNIKAIENIDIDFLSAYKYYRDSNKNVIVAVIDTGIDFSHNSLSDRMWQNEGEIPNNGIDDDQNGYTDDVYGWNLCNNTNEIYAGSDDDHGTHVAGTIVNTAKSENIKIMSIKVLSGKNSTGSIETIIRGIKYAEENGASVCNLSLATTKNNPELYEAIKESKLLFSVAAGNDGQNIDKSPVYPACYDLPNVISVSNIGYDGLLYKTSNFGYKNCSIAAPGVDILGACSSNSFKYMTGTSMSASYVSATAALVFSHCGKNISIQSVKNLILASSDKLETLEGKVTCSGMLNLGNVMRRLNLLKREIIQ